MGKEIENVRDFALLGKNIGYSFSRKYFSEKFQNENISNARYFNMDIPSIDYLMTEIRQYPNLQGFNVTIPYKETILPFLDEIDSVAREIGAVNTVKILSDGTLKGYNTDCYGFYHSLKSLIEKSSVSALILGSGGASKAVSFTLKSMNINYIQVSRTPKGEQLSYGDLSKDVIEKHQLIINCTPLGTFPNISDFPPIPYHFIGNQHILYDLIYNPAQTMFLQNGEKQGALTCNGLKMLQLQAKKSWEIWNNWTENKPYNLF